MSNSNDYQVGEIHTHGEIDTRYINVKSIYDQKNDQFNLKSIDLIVLIQYTKYMKKNNVAKSQSGMKRQKKNLKRLASKPKTSAFERKQALIMEQMRTTF